MIHPKSALIERSKQLGFDKPQFDTKRTGPQHEPTFISDALLNGEVYGTGQGGTKRDAERHASEEALALLEQNAKTSNKARNDRTDNPSNDQQPRKNGLTGNGIAKHDTTNHDTVDIVNSVDSNAQPIDELFEGPWPLVPDVLATSLHIANSRVNPGAQGADAIRDVHALAVELYKASLQSLGEVVEIEE